ncbi:MAG: diaminopimelate decarboxylase [Chloroflexi bacterium]|nr:MAG: diaminopimelate decarboxylase [Chloroflexota bacterium]
MNTILSLFPNGTAVDAHGHLTLRGQRAGALAEQFGTPLYVYDVGTIRDNINAYRRGLERYSGAAQLTYASKAFLCTALARLLSREKVGFDVASAGEIFVARQGGANPAHMHLHGNNKTTLDLTTALQSGVGQIVVDNTAELDRLAALAETFDQTVNIWLRVTPGVAVQTHHQFTVTGTADSKFGFPLDTAADVAGKLLARAQTLRLRLTGLHIHLGSHFHDARPVAAAIEKLLDVAQSLREEYGWAMQDLCPGGGWGVPYHPADPPMPAEPFVAGLVQAVENGCRRRNLPLPRLILEPGRSVVAQAGVALYTVGARKEIAGVRTYVAVDGGLADNPRPALYGAKYSALLANRAAEAAVETVAVAGPFCESGDILIQEVALPRAQPGDILAVPVAGAYQLSMSSNYNAALRPAVVFLEQDSASLVIRRETFKDLVRRDQ